MLMAVVMDIRAESLLEQVAATIPKVKSKMARGEKNPLSMAVVTNWSEAVGSAMLFWCKSITRHAPKNKKAKFTGINEKP